MFTITRRLNADLAAYPPPRDDAWSPWSVYTILANPKYTGHMVFGRRTRKNGKVCDLPAADWLWSAEPSHPAIVTRQAWDAAQAAGHDHATARDEPGPATHPQARRAYVLRSRVRCRACNRRMSGSARTSGATGDTITYYYCPHDSRNPRHVAASPDHPRTVGVREDRLLAAVRQFFDERITGPDRRRLLDAAIPADAARRARQEATLAKRLRQIDTAENAHAREIEALAASDAPAAAITALRTRIIQRFTELETDRAGINATLTALAAADNDTPGDPGLLDTLPDIAGILRAAPEHLQRQVYDAFALQLLYHRKDDQVTIRATITTTTPDTLAAIIRDHHQHTALQPAISHLLGHPRLLAFLHR